MVDCLMCNHPITEFGIYDTRSHSADCPGVIKGYTHNPSTHPDGVSVVDWVATKMHWAIMQALADMDKEREVIVRDAILTDNSKTASFMIEIDGFPVRATFEDARSALEKAGDQYICRYASHLQLGFDDPTVDGVRDTIERFIKFCQTREGDDGEPDNEN